VIWKHSHNTAIVSESSDQISYRVLLDVAGQIGKHIMKRCLVFLICRNCFESIAGYLGFIRNKAVPVPINDSINNTFLQIYLKLINLSMFFYNQLELILETLGLLNGRRCTVGLATKAKNVDLDSDKALELPRLDTNDFTL
jgi:acyl-CoA synthetase (AMP-forming)/AMP-acid ligase II